MIDLFQQTPKMVFVVGHGRTGKSYLHALFDGHPQVLQLHCLLKFHRWWKLFNLEGKSLAELKNFFERKSNLRHLLFNNYNRAQLGEKNYFGPIQIDHFRFWQTFDSLIQKHGLNRRNVFLAIHQAYWEVCLEAPRAPLFLMENAHNHDSNTAILEDFPDAHFIHLLRDPRSSYRSYLRSYQKGGELNWTMECWSQIYTSFIMAGQWVERLGRDRYLVLKSEELSLHPEHTIKTVLNWLEGEWHPCLLTPSMGGKEWKTNQRGAKAEVSGQFHFEQTTWEVEKLRWRERMGVCYALGKEMSRYGYRPSQKSFLLMAFSYLLFLFVPPKEEYIGPLSKEQSTLRKIFRLGLNVASYPHRITWGWKMWRRPEHAQMK